MRNKMLLAIASLFILAGCTKNNQQSEKDNLTKVQAFKAHVEKRDLQIAKIGVSDQGKNIQSPPPNNAGTCNKVVICHKGNYISVNKSAVAAHMAHGDKLTCCATSCINESAELLNSGPFEWYYDEVADDCFGYQHHGSTWVAIAYSAGYIAAESFSHHGMTHYYVYTHKYSDHSFPCLAEVTQSEFECAREYLRSYIAANSCIPNLCDLL